MKSPQILSSTFLFSTQKRIFLKKTIAALLTKLQKALDGTVFALFHLMKCHVLWFIHAVQVFLKQIILSCFVCNHCAACALVLHCVFNLRRSRLTLALF